MNGEAGRTARQCKSLAWHHIGEDTPPRGAAFQCHATAVGHDAVHQCDTDAGIEPCPASRPRGEVQRTRTRLGETAVMLEGLHRQPNVLMPGFAKELSDTQIATLSSYLVQHFGNPAARVTAKQVAELRAGPTPSVLVMLAQAALAVGTLIVVGFIALWLRRWRKTRPAMQSS